jgi:apolipoprotein N-acyltransferase
MAQRDRDPHLRPLLFSASLAALFGALAIAETDSWWVVGATVGAFVLLVLAIVLDVSGADGRGPDAPTG